MATRRFVPVVAAGMILAAIWLASASAEPLAIVAAIKGRVEVASAKGGPPARAAFGRALERGDRVVVSSGGAVSIFFNDGNVIELAEKSTITIGGRVTGKSRAGATPGIPGGVYASVSKFVSGGSRETGLVALSALRGGADSAPLLIEPRRTGLLDLRPSFRWRAVEGATRYLVAVSGEQGELWNREIGGTTLDYPSDAPPLTAGGDFFWQVRAFGDRGELRREESYVRVLATEDAAAVRVALARIGDSAGGANAPATRFLSGSYLSGRGLYGEAAAQFEALSLLSPDAPAPHEALGNIYRAVGLMDLAAAEYQQALTLSR